jgi:microcystin-dependent protein
MWLVDNQTGGSAYTVTVKTSAGGSLGVTPPRGYITYVYSDGTNVGYADGGGIYALTSQFAFVPTGTVLPFAGTVGVPGYLYCDGLPYSRTTYANLFATIGTTWGAGDGSTTFNVPNFQNMFLRGVGTQGLGVEEADSFKSHTHTANVTDPGHNHQTALVAGSNTGYGRGTSISGIGGFSFLTDLSTLTQTKTTGVTVANDATGGTETRPVNKRVYYIIKT